MITLQLRTRINIQTQRINFFYPISIYSFVLRYSFYISFFLFYLITSLIHPRIFHISLIYLNLSLIFLFFLYFAYISYFRFTNFLHYLLNVGKINPSFLSKMQYIYFEIIEHYLIESDKFYSTFIRFYRRDK